MRNIFDYHYFKQVLDNPPDVTSVDKWKNTLLHLAVRSENPYIVERLLELNSKGKCPLDINARNEGGKTAILIAAKLGNYELFKMLLRHGADVNINDEKCNHILHMAIKGGCHKIVNRVMELKSQNKFSIDIDAKNKYRMTALRAAVLLGDIDAVEVLISAGAKTKHVPEWQKFSVLLADLGVPVQFAEISTQKKSSQEIIEAISKILDLSISSFPQPVMREESDNPEFHYIGGKGRKINRMIDIDTHGATGATELPQNEGPVRESTFFFKDLNRWLGTMNQKGDLACNQNDENYWVKVSRASLLIDSGKEISQEQLTGSSRSDHVANVCLSAMEKRPTSSVRDYQRKKGLLECYITYHEEKIRKQGKIGRMELTELIRRKKELKKIKENFQVASGYNIMNRTLLKRRILGLDEVVIACVKPDDLSSLGEVLATTADRVFKVNIVAVGSSRRFRG